MPQNHRPQKPARAACPSQSPALQMSGGFLWLLGLLLSQLCAMATAPPRPFWLNI
jgi:hypothetical protein